LTTSVHGVDPEPLRTSLDVANYGEGVAMTSEILVRRYDKIFSLYDSDKNGYVEEADVKRLQGQMLAIFGESPTSERGADVARL